MHVGLGGGTGRRPRRIAVMVAALAVLMTTALAPLPAAADAQVVFTAQPFPGLGQAEETSGRLHVSIRGADVENGGVSDGEIRAWASDTPVDIDVERRGGAVVVTGRIPPLPAGDHSARVHVTTADGATAQHDWRFTVAAARTDRVSGPDRIATAIAVSERIFEDQQADAVVLSRADVLADALAGAPLAADIDAPLLLTASDALDERVRAEVERVLPSGGEVHLLGGGAALSHDIVVDLVDAGYEMRRHHGADRIETAMAIAAQMSDPERAFVVGAGADIDAATASTVAARAGWAVVLTPADRMLGRVASTLSDAGIERVHVVGGAQAVSDPVLERLTELGFAVDRTSGASRYETAAQVAARWPGDGGVAMTDGGALPDALTGAVLAAEDGDPLLLTASDALPEATGDVIAEQQPDQLQIVGGSHAVPARIVHLALSRHSDGDAALVESDPAWDSTTSEVEAVRLTLDRSVDAERSETVLLVDGRAVRSSISGSGSTIDITAESPITAPDPDSGRTVEVSARIATTGGPKHVQGAFEVEPPPGPVVHLTFDDGPHPSYTPQILDTMARHDAQGTFYVLGSVANHHRDLLRRIHDDGHGIQNHTWSHRNLVGASDSAIRNEIMTTRDLVQHVTGQATTCLRPPFGATNARVRDVAASMGHSIELWDVDPQDWRRPGASTIADRVISQARPGAVILLHDGGGERSQTVAALDMILTELGSRGYRFTAMCD